MQLATNLAFTVSPLATALQFKALVLVAAQIGVFALVAFPLKTLVESFRVALGWSAAGPDAASTAVGVFTALGRASLLAGVNGALLSSLYTVFLLDAPDKVGAGVAAGVVCVLYGALFRVLVALPLETRAFNRIV